MATLCKGEVLERLLDRVDRSELSSIKTIVAGIIQVINDPSSAAKQLRDLIENDPGLSVRILRRANSAYYGARGRISEIQQAIVWIGFSAVKELALSQKVCEIFGGGKAFNGYSRLELWKHSMAVAHCAKLIYRREFCLSGEDAYAAGLLHDMGVIAEDQHLPEEFERVLTVWNAGARDLRRAELQVMGFDHAAAGAEIGRRWLFPESLCGAIERHHDPCVAVEGQCALAGAVAVADFFCQKAGLGFGDASAADADDVAACMAELAIKPKAMDLLIENVREDLARMQEEGWFDDGS